MIDIAAITAELRVVRADCGWLMLVDGRQKLNSRDFADAAELLEGGVVPSDIFTTKFCQLLFHPFIQSINQGFI